MSQSKSPSSRDTHRRTNSAPPKTPHIDIEDVSNGPLLNTEDITPSLEPETHAGQDPNQTPTRPPLHTRTSNFQHFKKPVNPNVAWRKQWSKDHDPFRDGRVLIVDLLSRDQSEDKKRQTLAHELTSPAELSAFYDRTGPGAKKIVPCLRIVHVQNSIWGRDFMFKKYGIADPSNPQRDGNAFAKWAQFSKPQRRNNRPVLNARAFRVDKSPLRNVWRIGFGADYLRYFAPSHMQQYSENGREAASASADEYKLLSMNRWMVSDGENSYAANGFDCYVQRLSVYVQRNMDDAGLANEDWNYAAASSYAPRDSEELERAERDEQKTGKNVQEIKMKKQKDNIAHYRDDFDNGTTIILFESSHSGLVSDTLIQARAEIEKKWRRLFSDLPRDDFATDSLLALECINVAIGYVLSGLIGSWDKLLSKLEEHVDILEEKIYENPADESRAPELWQNQNLWLKVEKLLYVQMEAFTTLRQYLRELSTENKEFLREAPDQFSRIAKIIEEDLTKPTHALSDLMYKSVEIRDSRQSLQLGLSMWRLSWITFIFLPLTFISGFFGMNVAIFQPADGNFPGLKWYFIVAVPLMLLVVILYVLVKNNLSFRRVDPLARGTYEDIFESFAAEHPQLWSRNGPRDYVRAKGVFSRIKWALVTRWFAPSRTISAKPIAEINDLGVWARIKHTLAQQWLKDIQIHPDDDGHAERGRSGLQLGTVMELVGYSTPIAMAEGNPRGAVEMASSAPARNFMGRRRASSQSSSGSGKRSGFGSSAIRMQSPSPSEGMVEEEPDTTGQEDMDEYDEWEKGRKEAEGKAEKKRQREMIPAATVDVSTLLAIPASR